jgi:hypothetical protein
MRTACDIATILSSHIEDLARHLLGEPRQRTTSEWRYGAKGSLSVVTRGRKRGKFFNYESGANGDALELVKATFGTSTIKAMRWADEWLGGSMTELQVPPFVNAPLYRGTVNDVAARIEAARRIWNGTIELPGSVAWKYLEHRGISPPEYVSDLRFHAACPVYRGAINEPRLPAMVALFRDIITNEPKGIHRTFLLPDGTGKDARYGYAKKMLGVHKGCAVKLADDSEVTLGLGLSEGIENGLTLGAWGWWPIWAAGDAGSIGAFPVLAGIECLTIFADADDRGTGIDNARRCARHWSVAGKRAEIQKAPVGADWNDAAREFAP